MTTLAAPEPWSAKRHVLLGNGIGLSLLAALATVGEILVLQVEHAADLRNGLVGLPELHADIAEIWHASHAFVTGASHYPWYGDSHLLGYAPPYAVLFSPLGALPLNVVVPLSALLSAALAAVVVVGWSGGWTRLRPWGLALLLSDPVFNLVRLGQFQSALGLAALSLAIWAQQRGRWRLVGGAMAIGAIRTPNAVPVLAMLIVGGWRRWRSLGEATLVGLCVMVPLAILAFIWDSHWVGDWLVNLSADQQAGVQRLFKASFGGIGLFLLGAGGAGAAALLVRGRAGHPLDLDRAALGLGLGVVLTHISGAYVAVFVIPAVVRLAMRPGFALVAWGVAAVPWLLVVGGALADAGGYKFSGLVISFLLSAVPFLMLVAVYPLMRPPRQAAGVTG